MKDIFKIQIKPTEGALIKFFLIRFFWWGDMDSGSTRYDPTETGRKGRF
jgi:hypothetical protein